MIRRRRNKNIPLLVAMTRAGLTTVELAQQSGISRSTVSAILNNRVFPKSETISAIADVLDAQPAKLGFDDGGDS